MKRFVFWCLGDMFFDPPKHAKNGLFRFFTVKLLSVFFVHVLFLKLPNSSSYSNPKPIEGQKNKK